MAVDLRQNSAHDTVKLDNVLGHTTTFNFALYYQGRVHVKQSHCAGALLLLEREHVGSTKHILRKMNVHRKTQQARTSMDEFVLFRART